MSLFHQSLNRWVSAWWDFFFGVETGNITVVMLPLHPPHLFCIYIITPYTENVFVFSWTSEAKDFQV